MQSNIEKTVLIIGRSKLPEGVTVKKIHDHFALSARIDLKYGAIIIIESTLVISIVNDFYS